MKNFLQFTGQERIDNMNRMEHRKELEQRRSEIKYIQDLIIKGGYCVLCGFNRDPRILELHHIAGRKNSDVVIPLCPNCHRSLSMSQEPDKIERGKDEKTDEKKIGWNMQGYSLLMKLLSYNLQDQAEILLGDDYNE